MVLSVRQRCVPAPQLPLGVTQRLPPAKVDEKASVMLLVVEVPVAPVGSVQAYEVAPLTAGTVYTIPVALLQTCAGPLNAPVAGREGRKDVKTEAEVAEQPAAFFTVTEKVPAVVTEILWVVAPFDHK